LDYPGLKCSDCRESYEEGELADAEGKLIYNGGCPAALFRCRDCPYVLYGDPDEYSQLAQEIWQLYTQWLIPDHPTSLDFIFRLMGVRVGSPESREIYQRMLELSRILHEHHELAKGEGQEPAAEDEQD
jgi:hypothetical protein